MIISFRGPEWFYGIDVIIEIILTLIVLGLVVYGYKAYKLTKQKKFLYFFLGFLIIALDFFIHSIINAYVYYNIIKFNYCSLSCQLGSIKYLFYNCLIFYSIMHLFAYFLLSSMYIKFKNKFKIMFLLFTFFAIILYFRPYLFNIFAILFLIPIVYYAYKNYYNNNNLKSKLVFMAFTSIILAHIFFFLEIKYIYFYVLGMATLLIGYSLLLYLLILVKKNGKKTR